jgi:hypothetical protein
MAAVVPISTRSGSISFAIATLGVAALIRIGGFAFDAPPARGLPQLSRLTSTIFRQSPTTIVKSVVLEGSSRNTCVMALGRNSKLFVGSGEPNRDVIVSLAACDLYNASREMESTELVGGASLSARNIFLSGGYALSAGALMTASRYLAAHTSPADDPYARLKVPSYAGCTKDHYKLDARKTATISPGVYCGGIEVTGGATLNLDPGSYILDRGNFTVVAGGTVNGTGVTIILTSRTGSNYGSVNIRAGSAIAISAPVVGAGAGIPGVAIWVDERAPAAGDTFDGGTNQNINGAVYLPSREARYSGGSSAGTRCSQLVASSVTFTGNSYFRHDCAGAGLSDPVPPPLLVE